MNKDLLIIGEKPEEILVSVFIELQDDRSLGGPGPTPFIPKDSRQTIKMLLGWMMGVFESTEEIKRIADEKEREKTAIIATLARFKADPIECIENYIKEYIHKVVYPRDSSGNISDGMFPSEKVDEINNFLESQGLYTQNPKDFIRAHSIWNEYSAKQISLYRMFFKEPINLTDYPNTKSPEGALIIEIRRMYERERGIKDPKAVKLDDNYIWLDARSALQELFKLSS